MTDKRKYVVFLPVNELDFTPTLPCTIIAVEYKEKGYWAISARSSAQDLNEGLFDEAPSMDVMNAAIIGSVFGWDVPGAKRAKDFFEAEILKDLEKSLKAKGYDLEDLEASNPYNQWLNEGVIE